MGDFSLAVAAFQKASDMRSNLLGEHEVTAESYHWPLGLAQFCTRDFNGTLDSLQTASRMSDHHNTPILQKLGSALSWLGS